MPTDSFFKFLFAFVLIIAAAFGLLLFANSEQGAPQGVDSVAHPR